MMEKKWEQRRYEIAKDIMAAYISNGSYACLNSNQVIASWSVMAANALIRELKG